MAALCKKATMSYIKEILPLFGVRTPPPTTLCARVYSSSRRQRGTGANSDRELRFNRRGRTSIQRTCDNCVPGDGRHRLAHNPTSARVPTRRPVFIKRCPRTSDAWGIDRTYPRFLFGRGCALLYARGAMPLECRELIYAESEHAQFH